ncbi:DUF4179 domain-containing protein [Heyndrickxia oleronia]|jgi:hypothetical protein|uniref:DUF4179 domain-containing protein n=1 Tax=Heyndrickxia oleronia TaxID=38875 RepID=UPI001F1E770F|nr:DUF4179 domain-containing protein [Heyndrickxia oleronia]
MDLRSIEDLLKVKVKNDNIDIPNENKMWNKVVSNLQKGDQATTKRLMKPKLVISVILMAIVLTTTPVLAKYSNELLEWMRDINGNGIITSLENGFGQEINKTTKNGLGVLQVHNVVSDENGTTINISLDIDHDHSISAAGFDDALLIMEDGKEEKLDATVVYNKKYDKLVGYLHTDKEISADSKVILQIGGLSEIQTKTVKLKSLIQDDTKTIPINQDGISQIKFISNEYRNGEYQIDYLIELEEKNNIDHASLVFSFQDKRILSSGVVYKRPQPNVLKLSESFRLDKNELDNVEMSLAYNDRGNYYPEMWQLEFEYNYNLAKKSTYTMKLNKTIDMGIQKLQLKNLVITPSRVKIYFDKKNSNSESNEVFINYNEVTLQIGDESLEGYIDSEGYISFETQGVLENIKSKQISLSFNNARVSYKGGKQDKVRLTNISNEPNTIHTEIKGFPIEITYYSKGNDLIVESESNDNRFGGITQSVIYKKDKRIFADKRSEDGLHRHNNQVETFKNIKDKDLTLNIFLFTVYEERPKTVILK